MLKNAWIVRAALFLLAGFSGGFAASEFDLFDGLTTKETKASQAKKRYQKDVQWAKKIIGGGYILHFRHADREKWVNVTGFDVYEILNGDKGETTSYANAVCLSKKGVEEAKLVGKIFEMAGVKVSFIASSPSCRARQTAELAFGRIDAIKNSLIHRRSFTHEDRLRAAKDLRSFVDKLSITKPDNIVLSSHGSTLRFDMGTFVDENEAGSAMDRRKETGFTVLEMVGSKIIARHSYKHISAFANAVLELPLN